MASWYDVPSILELVRSEIACISDWQPLHFEEVQEDEVVDNIIDVICDDDDECDKEHKALEGCHITHGSK